MSRQEIEKEMKKEMRNISSWCCKSCGWISEYNITHRKYADGDCKKINQRDMRKTLDLIKYTKTVRISYDENGEEVINDC